MFLPVHGEGIPELVQPLGGALVPGVDDPPVGLHENSGPEVAVRVPPVRWAGSGAACAQDALVETVL